jgi:hypothetical protein
VAYLRALAEFKGNVDGQGSIHSCDLSGTVPGRLNSTDILDQLRDDTRETLLEEDYAVILSAYEIAYNKSAAKTIKEMSVPTEPLLPVWRED